MYDCMRSGYAKPLSGLPLNLASQGDWDDDFPPERTFFASYPCSAPCPAGKFYSYDSSSTGCDTCPAGSYLSDLATAAARHDSVDDCTACAAGRFLAASSPADASDHDSVDDCHVCPAGKFNEESGRTACVDCPPGGEVVDGP